MKYLIHSGTQFHINNLNKVKVERRKWQTCNVDIRSSIWDNYEKSSKHLVNVGKGKKRNIR